MVTHYSVKDSTVLSSLGHHDKECHWTVQAGPDAVPIEISVHVTQSTGVGRKKVLVKSGKEQIFPPNGQPKQELKENFKHTWPFRAEAKNINEKGVYQVRPEHMAAETWYPATITKQQDDGRFDALVTMPSISGEMQELSFNNVRREDIRTAAKREPMKIPERHLMLEVPNDDPLQAALFVDGKDLVTHYFARPTPPPKGKVRHILLQVDQKRSTVEADIGPAAFEDFLSSEPRAISSNGNRYHYEWKFQVGPFAVHHVKIEKKSRGRHMTITVDDEALVEATAADILCETPQFECTFKLVGQRVLNFEVYETNKDGDALSSKATVTQKQKYSVPICVMVPDESLETAKLFADKREFRTFRQASEYKEDNLKMNPKAMNMQYKVLAPYKVNLQAPSGVKAMLGKVETAMEGSSCAGGSGGGFFSLFSACCRSNTTDKEKELEVTRTLPPAPQDDAKLPGM